MENNVVTHDEELDEPTHDERVTDLAGQIREMQKQLTRRYKHIKRDHKQLVNRVLRG